MSKMLHGSPYFSRKCSNLAAWPAQPPQSGFCISFQPHPLKSQSELNSVVILTYLHYILLMQFILGFHLLAFGKSQHMNPPTGHDSKVP